MINKKQQGLSTPAAIIIAGIIIGFSVFFTTLFFFGGSNNRTKLFVSNPTRPAMPVNFQTNTNTNPVNNVFPPPTQQAPKATTTVKTASPTVKK